jgi:hypothetical protein
MSQSTHFILASLYTLLHGLLALGSYPHFMRSPSHQNTKFLRESPWYLSWFTKPVALFFFRTAEEGAKYDALWQTRIPFRYYHMALTQTSQDIGLLRRVI